MRLLGFISCILFLGFAFYSIYVILHRLYRVFVNGEPPKVINKPIFYYFDEKRIKNHFSLKNLEVQSIDYKPFGTGWFFSNGSIYLVKYYNLESQKNYSVYVKTSFYADVYVHEKVNNEP